jgi:hypothetical protein
MDNESMRACREAAAISDAMRRLVESEQFFCEPDTLPPLDGPMKLKDGTVIRPADLVNHPPHYTNGPGCPHCGNVIECITITEQMNFCLGNAVKYIWRKEAKGKPLEDLRKARWYIDREIARMEVEG